MMKKFKFLLVVFFLTTLSASAQVKIGDNPTSLNGDAVLEMESANKGLLLPRVALTSTSAFAPLSAHVQGMTVYNTATAGDVTPGYYYNNGTKWVRLADATSFANADATKDAWVDDAANSIVKLGTKSDGTARDAGTEMVVTDDGKVGLGTTAPTATLDVKGNFGTVNNEPYLANVFSHFNGFDGTSQQVNGYRNDLQVSQGTITKELTGISNNITLKDGVNIPAGSRSVAQMNTIKFEGGNITSSIVGTQNKVHIKKDFSNFIIPTTSSVTLTGNNTNITGEININNASVYSSGTNNQVDYLSGYSVYFANRANWSAKEVRGLTMYGISTGTEKNYGIYLGDVGNATATQNYAIYTKKGTIRFGDRVHISKVYDVGLNNEKASFMIGNTNVGNLIIDDNEIMARNNGNNSTLYLQADGGAVTFNNSLPASRVVIEEGKVKAQKLESKGYVKVGDEFTATPEEGMIRFNKTTKKFQGYDGTAWVDLH